MEEQSLERIANIEKEARTFTCPSCGKRLKFTVTVQVNGVRKEDEWEAGAQMQGNAPTPPRRGVYTDEENAIIEKCRASGVFDAFWKAVELSPGPNPSFPERAFLQLPNIMVQSTKVPQMALKFCLPEDDRSGRLELWKCGYVEAIVRNNEILTFLPVGAVLKGKSPDKLTLSDGKEEGVSLDYWVRTRFGYVAGKGLLFSELRQKSIGAFSGGLLT